jgi:uncharacterized protein YhbP (UPF0306 family)
LAKVRRTEGGDVALVLSNADYDGGRLYAIVRGILDSTELCSMATLAGDGTPHINTAYFACDDELRLYFLSNPASLHCQNIATRPRMAVAVFDSRQPWGAPGKGLQLLGVGAVATDKAGDRARAVYGTRYPLFREFSSSADVSSRGASFQVLRLYEFTPSRVKILDEEQLVDEINVAAEIRRFALSSSTAWTSSSE